jgi:chemotaxis protein MotB
MAASDKNKGATIVIKKITVGGAGAHGGSWKVAFADFMTAMMAFFLVMWLLNTSEQTKKQIAKYFSGPSIIEQQLNAYGAELTLEKLFLDLVNEPLKAFQAFTEPADLTPDLLSLGMKKVVMMQIAEQLGDVAKNVEVTDDEISFDIPDHYLFEKNAAQPSGQFVNIMEKVKVLTTGLEHSDIGIKSVVLSDTFPAENANLANDVSNARLDLIKTQVASSLEHDSNSVLGEAVVSNQKWHPGNPRGLMKFRIKQKKELPKDFKPRILRDELGSRRADTQVYDDFVRRMSESSRKKRR